MQKSFSSRCFISKPLESILGHSQLFYKFRSGYQLFLVDRQVNACDYLLKKASSPIIDILLPTFKKYLTSNVSLACPYQGRFDITGLPLSGGLFNNMFIPVGEYYLNLTVYANKNKDFIWNGKFFFVVPDGKTIEDTRMGR